MDNTEQKLEICELTAGYGDIQVLWGLDIDINAGEAVCIIGSNGAGKSTLLRTISGMVPTTGGTISLNDQTVDKATPEDMLSAGVVHVPEGRRLFSAMSVRDNLLMGSYLRRDKAAIKDDLEKVYQTFPLLAERSRQDAGTLSGGEQQMCAIGRGIMGRPKYLMIDELSLGLAPRAVELLLEALDEINNAGVAILLVEQDVMHALEFADRAFVVDRGKVIVSGTSDEIAANPLVQEAYMGIA
jgi:branched-chain amino acid transport system ATP-binding protein